MKNYFTMSFLFTREDLDKYFPKKDTRIVENETKNNGVKRVKVSESLEDVTKNRDINLFSTSKEDKICWNYQKDGKIIQF